MENNYKVYMHIFPNGKRYIGITNQSPNRRWRGGKGYYKTTQRLVYNAIAKYGWDNIKHLILKENLSKEQAENEEIKLIKEYKTFNRKYGYNRTSGGDCNPMRGKHHTKRALKIISEHSKGENNPAARKVYQYDLQGKFIAEYKTAKEAAKATGINFVGISKCRAGSRLSAGGYIWKYNKSNNVSRKPNYYKKAVLQFDLQNNFIREWSSATEAAKSFGVLRESIRNACNGKSKTSCGYKWKLKGEK